MGRMRHLSRMPRRNNQSKQQLDDVNQKKMKRIAKQRRKLGIDALDDEDHHYEPEKLQKIITEEAEILKSIDSTADRDSLNEMSFTISIPESYQEFKDSISGKSEKLLLIYLKRMREYNSFLAN